MEQRPDERLVELHASHTPEAIRSRLSQSPARNDLRDFIFGAIDGTVTTFAIVSGVSGAGLSVGILIIMGVANLVADGFSMGVSNFLGSRAQQQQCQRVRREEELHVRTVPEGEKEEIRQIFASKGFSGDELERVVEVITEDPERWVTTMLREEHGFPATEAPPWRSGLITYIGFMVAGLAPLLPYLYDALAPSTGLSLFFWSAALAGVVFFLIGALKSGFVDQRWYWSGLETLAVGGAAAGLAYIIGVLLRGMANGI